MRKSVLTESHVMVFCVQDKRCRMVWRTSFLAVLTKLEIPVVVVVAMVTRCKTQIHTLNAAVE